MGHSAARALGIPTQIFPQVIQPGTVLGELLPMVADETGASGVPVIAPACHDTGSAVAAVPASRPRLCLDQLRHVVDYGHRAACSHDRRSEPEI